MSTYPDAQGRHVGGKVQQRGALHALQPPPAIHSRRRVEVRHQQPALVLVHRVEKVEAQVLDVDVLLTSLPHLKNFILQLSLGSACKVAVLQRLLRSLPNRCPAQLIFEAMLDTKKKQSQCVIQIVFCFLL